MKKFKLLIFPSYITTLVNAGEINAEQLMDKEDWGNIFSGSTVKKITQLNGFTGGGDKRNDMTLNTLGLSWITNYADKGIAIPPKFNLLETLMSDGRESEVDILFEQLHNFGASFTWIRASNGTYLILLNDLHPLNCITERLDVLRSNMGKLIDDMSSLVIHDDIVCEPILQSYMKNNH